MPVQKAKQDPEPRALKVADFKCLYCGKKRHHSEQSFRVRKACCRACYLTNGVVAQEDKVEGPWLMNSGLPRPKAVLKV